MHAYQITTRLSYFLGNMDLKLFADVLSKMPRNPNLFECKNFIWKGAALYVTVHANASGQATFTWTATQLTIIVFYFVFIRVILSILSYHGFIEKWGKEMIFQQKGNKMGMECKVQSLLKYWINMHVLEYREINYMLMCM